MYRIFRPSGHSFEQSTLQVAPVSVDAGALGQSNLVGSYALLVTGAAPVNYKVNGAISGTLGATNAMYLPPNSQVVVRVEAGETLSWQHASGVAGTFNVTFGSPQ